MAKRRANGEGSIYKRQDSMWTAQYTDFTGKRRYLYGKTQQAVKDKLKKAIQENDDGILSDAGRILFAKWAAEWLEVYAKPVICQRRFDFVRKRRLKFVGSRQSGMYPAGVQVAGSKRALVTCIFCFICSLRSFKR